MRNGHGQSAMRSGATRGTSRRSRTRALAYSGSTRRWMASAQSSAISRCRHQGLEFGEASTGAVDDLARATDLARRMVTEFGMSPVLGPVRLATDMQANYLNQQLGLDARVSPETATLVDTETRRIIEEAVTEARSRLENHRVVLDRLADMLCEQETVDGAQIDALLNGMTIGAQIPILQYDQGV